MIKSGLYFLAIRKSVFTLALVFFLPAAYSGKYTHLTIPPLPSGSLCDLCGGISPNMYRLDCAQRHIYCNDCLRPHTTTLSGQEIVDDEIPLASHTSFPVFCPGCTRDKTGKTTRATFIESAYNLPVFCTYCKATGTFKQHAGCTPRVVTPSAPMQTDHPHDGASTSGAPVSAPQCAFCRIDYGEDNTFNFGIIPGAAELTELDKVDVTLKGHNVRLRFYFDQSRELPRLSWQFINNDQCSERLSTRVAIQLHSHLLQNTPIILLNNYAPISPEDSQIYDLELSTDPLTRRQYIYTDNAPNFFIRFYVDNTNETIRKGENNSAIWSTHTRNIYLAGPVRDGYKPILSPEFTLKTIANDLDPALTNDLNLQVYLVPYRNPLLQANARSFKIGVATRIPADELEQIMSRSAIAISINTGNIGWKRVYDFSARDFTRDTDNSDLSVASIKTNELVISPRNPRHIYFKVTIIPKYFEPWRMLKNIYRQM